MDPKLALLVMLIAVIVALSHMSEDNLARMRRPFVGGRWRNFVRIPRKI